MKFIVSSSSLAQTLQAIGKVISNKSPLPILDYFLFNLSGGKLYVTASDIETTLVATLEVENVGGEDGLVAVPARRIQDSLKEFAEQPLTLDIDSLSWDITISWRSGKLSLAGITGCGYPEQQVLDSETLNSATFATSILAQGISTTIFATADNSLRPVMNGINVAISTQDITFVATDAHRLVRVINSSVKGAENSSFILPAKPAHLLRSILPKDDSIEVTVEFDSKNVVFTLPSYKMICRQIEGNYPDYNSAIPLNNDNKLTIDRLEFLASLRRVSVCSSQASGLIRLSLTPEGIAITAQDLSFNTSAEDNIACQYVGEDMEIGFKAQFLIDILSNLSTSEVFVELSDPTRPGLFCPVDSTDEEVSLLMLLMPMMVNA
ncbi:MAG: DNA polymerase III subunit beta [Rikenellaceae bacterium]